MIAGTAITTVLLALGALALLTLVGYAALSVLRPALQRRLLPAAPLIGAAVLVVGLHWTGLLVGARWGGGLLFALAAALILVQGVRGRLDGRSLLRGARGLEIVLLVGLIGATIIWLPLLRSGDAMLVQSGDSYDAFYYVTTSRWLTDHSYLSVPQQVSAPGHGTLAPIFGPAGTSIVVGLRLGQEMLQGAFAGATGVSVASGYTAWLGVWVLLMPGAVWVLGGVFGMPRWFRAVVGLASAVSLSLVGQALASNADSLLGVALVPLTIALFAAVLLPAADGRPPLALATVVLAGLVGTYTEYGPFVLPVLAAIALIGPRVGYRRRVGRAAAVVGVALLVNPVIWWRALISLGVTGSVAATPIGRSGVSAHLTRLLGPFEAAVLDWRGGAGAFVQAAWIVLVLLGLLAGVVIGLWWLDTRGLAVGVLAALAVAVYFALRGNDYVTGRVSGMVLPLLIVGAGVGWSRLLPGLSVRPVRGLSVAGAVLGLVVVAAFLGLNARASLAAVTRPLSPQFTLGPEFAQAASWVKRYGGPGGRDVSVATASLFDQLWLSDELAVRPQVSYISLRGDLGYRGRLEKPTFWNGELDRYVLVGPGAYASAPADAIVERNARFTLIDTRAAGGAAVVAVPVQQSGHLFWIVDDRGGDLGMDGSGVVILNASGTGEGRALAFRDGRAGDRVQLLQSGHAVTEGTVSGRGTVDLPVADARYDDGVARTQVRVQDSGPLTLDGLVAAQ